MAKRINTYQPPAISYWCDTHSHRIGRPHLQCPNRIIKALRLYPKCILCNLKGSEIEGLRKRMGWSKREMAKRLDIPWQTYQAITDFRRSGTRSNLHSKVRQLIEKILENPRQNVRPEIIQELSLSPLDFFNRHIGKFPWEDEGKWPAPAWDNQVATRMPLQPCSLGENPITVAGVGGFQAAKPGIL